MNKSSKICIAGHKGMVGSAVHELLIKNGYDNIVGVSSSELDLSEPSKTAKPKSARTTPNQKGK